MALRRFSLIVRVIWSVGFNPNGQMIAAGNDDGDLIDMGCAHWSADEEVDWT
jgi:hypothetical protein